MKKTLEDVSFVNRSLQSARGNGYKKEIYGILSRLVSFHTYIGWCIENNREMKPSTKPGDMFEYIKEDIEEINKYLHEDDLQKFNDIINQ